MPVFSISPKGAEPAGKLTYTFAPSLLKAKTHVPALPAIPPQIGTISRTYRSRIPAKLATVSLVGRRDHSKSAPSVFFEEKEDEENFASLEECLQSRPPMQLDLTGPKPTSYDPPASMPWETSSPSYTMRPKTQPEKDKGGDRVAWSKQWFASPDIWTFRANFDCRYTWPSPAHYSSRATVGSPQFTLPQSPSHTFGKKGEFRISKMGAEDEPAPNQYNYNKGKEKSMNKSPSYTIQQGRRGGAVFWMAREPVPGPGSYNPRVYRTSSKRCAPAFTMSRTPREIGITQNCTL
ncbi:hypothetical protein OS493_016921 [Desmophyllum pertusum]|uniref:Uncharacterized protein n=1 Tax=Desmophyllum pertusum TaxID=174260 RepID=A0A9W9YNP7_9CNID|nr:hypothetical protein OS493_016921 [Desmophyllum pertusum]